MAIEDKPKRLRILSRGLDLKANANPIVPDGGDFGAGLIHGYSVVTEGEAISHGLWLDKEFLSQVVGVGNEKPNGVKMRFTHPGLSGDGLGTAVGKAKNFRLRAGQVFADAHFLQSAHELPGKGDAANYLMGLAEEAPEDFGSSIVFTPDYAAEATFREKNSDKEGRFISPEKKNRANLPHARLSTLNSSDFVDEPAANPDGVFSSGFSPGSELAMRAELLLAYAFGLTDEVPDELSVGPHPERARIFVQQFFERHGLLIMPEKSVRYEKDQIFTESQPSVADGLKALGIRVTALEKKLRAQFITGGKSQ